MATPPVFSAGSVLTAGQMNAVGLWLVKTDTITSGTSKEITGAFSSDYTNYRIVISNVRMNAVDGLYFRFGTANTGYYGSLQYDRYDGTANGYARNNNGAGLAIGYGEDFVSAGSSSFDVYNPQGTADRRNIAGNFYSAGYSGWFGGTRVTSTAYTSFTLYSAGGSTFSSCNIYVYGYRK